MLSRVLSCQSGTSASRCIENSVSSQVRTPALSTGRTLADLIPQDGFNDPPALDISAEKITSSFALPLPRLAVGMFSI